MKSAFDAYWDQVEAMNWPSDRRVPLPEPFENAAGTIQNLCLRSVTSVASITSHSKSKRANHYHKTDWHFTFVVSGSVVYLERTVGSTGSPELIETFKAGTMFFTPPMIEHCMLFPSDTVIITLAKNVRDHETHESDLVRVDFVSDEHAQQIFRFVENQ
jgi:hypothetical protein